MSFSTNTRPSPKSGGAKTFIASPLDEPSRVLGYHALAPASLAYARVPSIVTSGLGRYEVPVFRLGRLAVDRSVQGQGLGGRLLLAAAIRCLAVAEQVGGAALLIDAAGWYRGYGAVALEDAQLSLILPGHNRRGRRLERIRPEVSVLALIGDLHYPDGVPAFA